MWGLGVWAGTYYEAQRANHYHREAAPYEGPLDAGTFWKKFGGAPQSYASICNSPIDESQADLCQQWRSANAAEQMAGYALVSLLFGFAGLIGVGITVHLSNKATNAATEATRLARQAYERENRTWLKVTPSIEQDITFENGVARVPLHLDVKNIGSIPAKVRLHCRVFQRLGGAMPASPFDALISEFADDESTPTELPHGDNYRTNVIGSTTVLPPMEGDELERWRRSGAGEPSIHLKVVFVVFYRTAHQTEWNHIARNVTIALVPPAPEPTGIRRPDSLRWHDWQSGPQN